MSLPIGKEYPVPKEFNLFRSTCVQDSYTHHFPKAKESSQKTWNKIKTLLGKETENVKFLKKRLFAKSVQWEADKESFAKMLADSNPYSPEGYLLKEVLKKAGFDDLKKILDCTFERVYDTSGLKFEKVMNFFSSKVFEKEAEKSCWKAYFQEISDCLPSEKKEAGHSIYGEIKKTLRVVLRFFPNFMDTLLKAFNLIEAGKGPESIWDFAAMLEIYFKLFLIPHSIFVVVGALVSVPWQLFLITGIIVLAAVAGVCLYLKYRPCPNKLSRARNLTEDAELGKLEPVVGREKEIQQIGAYLGKKKGGVFTNIILVGEPGVGKTELVKGVAQKFRSKKIFSLNAPEFAGGYSSVGDLMRLILLDIKGHENEVILFFDEIGEAIKKGAGANLSGFLKPLLSPDGVQVIAALTSDEYAEVLKADDAFKERFTKIEINPTTKGETLEILKERIVRKRGSVFFEEGVAEEIYSLTKDKLQPRNSVKLLNLAMNSVGAFSIKKYASEELLKAKKKLRAAQYAYKEYLQSGSPKKEEIVSKIHALKETIANLKKTDEQKKKQALKIKQLIKKQRDLFYLGLNLAKKQSEPKKLFFLYQFLLPWMQGKVKTSGQELKEIPMVVDKKLLFDIFNKTEETRQQVKPETTDLHTITG